MDQNRMTVGDFLDLVKPLMQLPPDTPFTIGLGSANLDSDLGVNLAAAARRELVEGDALYEQACVALTVERQLKGGLQARLCLDTEWATYRGYIKWREYVYTEALALGIIEPADGADNNNPKTESHDNKEKENPSPRDADTALDGADTPGGFDPRLYPGGRDFYPDLDAIGI